MSGMDRGRVGKSSPSPSQMNPKLLPDGEAWERKCPHCVTKTQGGLTGLVNHIMTVHPGEAIPDS